jgi:hypothetical protein
MSLAIRSATPQDSAALARLAALDSRATLRGRALVADLNGNPVAAIGLATGAVVSDPYMPTINAVRALRERRYRLLRQAAA